MKQDVRLADGLAHLLLHLPNHGKKRKLLLLVKAQPTELMDACSQQKQKRYHQQEGCHRAGPYRPLQLPSHVREFHNKSAVLQGEELCER